MQITLRITAGHYAGRTIHLRDGQTAQIGKTDWADFSFPDEQELADVHFAVRCDADGCRIRNLDDHHETLVNGEPVGEAGIRNTDQITTGGVTWQVAVEGETVEQVASAEDPLEPEEEEPEEPLPTGLELATYLDMDEESLELASDEQSPDELLAALREGEMEADALLLKAFLLSPEEAVWWGCLCVRDVCKIELTGDEAEAAAAAERWVAEPNEIYRRGAQSAAEAAGASTIAAAICQAAFYSGGSITPPGYEEVPADERLTAMFIKGALLMAAYSGDASLAQQHIDDFFGVAADLEEDKIALPKP